MMRILLVARNFWPELVGVGFYVGALADWLHGRGHAVRVVTASPHYPAWRVPPAERTWVWRRDPRKPYPVLRTPIYVTPPTGAASRLLHVASLAASSLPAAVAEAVAFRPDIVGTFMPTLGTAPAALLAAALCRARAWLHVQDLEIDAALELGMLRGQPSDAQRARPRGSPAPRL